MENCSPTSNHPIFRVDVNRMLKESRLRNVVLYNLEKPRFIRALRFSAISQFLFWSFVSYVLIRSEDFSKK
jgi:hypothetical protein